MLPENHHPHSRYTLRETPWGFNASDLIHRDVSGPVFDLGVDLDDLHGIAYIRVSDVEEMGRVLGMATKAEVAALKARIDELNAEITVVPEEVEILKNGLSELVADFLDRIVPRNDLGSPVPAVDAGEEIEGQLALPISGDDDNAEGSGESSGQSSDVSVNKRSAKLSGSLSNEFGLPA